MALQAAAAAAVRAFWTEPVGTDRLDAIVLAAIIAGCLANGVSVAVLRQLDCNATTFVADVAGVCNQANVTAFTDQFLVRTWIIKKSTMTGVPTTNVAGQVTMLITTGVANGVAAPVIEQQVSAILNRVAVAAAPDFTESKYAVLLHMCQYMPHGVAGGGGKPDSNVLSNKIYSRHAGRTLLKSLALGKNEFEKYMHDVEELARANSEGAAADAIRALHAPLRTKFGGNWEPFQLYMKRLFEKHPIGTLAAPVDLSIIEDMQREATFGYSAFTAPASGAEVAHAAAIDALKEMKAQQQLDFQELTSRVSTQLSGAISAALASTRPGHALPPSPYGQPAAGYYPYAHPGQGYHMPPQHPHYPYAPPGAPPDAAAATAAAAAARGSARLPPQVPGSPGYTGCGKCGSMEHLSTNCPVKKEPGK